MDYKTAESETPLSFSSQFRNRAVLTHGPNGHLPGDLTSIDAPQERLLPCPGAHSAINTALFRNANRQTDILLITLRISNKNLIHHINVHKPFFMEV